MSCGTDGCPEEIGAQRFAEYVHEKDVVRSHTLEVVRGCKPLLQPLIRRRRWGYCPPQQEDKHQGQKRQSHFGYFWALVGSSVIHEISEILDWTLYSPVLYI